jgi:hypothetical protein
MKQKKKTCDSKKQATPTNYPVTVRRSKDKEKELLRQNNSSNHRNTKQKDLIHFFHKKNIIIKNFKSKNKQIKTICSSFQVDESLGLLRHI